MNRTSLALALASSLALSAPIALADQGIPGLPVKTVGGAIEIDPETDVAPAPEVIAPESKEAEALIAQIERVASTLPPTPAAAGMQASVSPPPARISVAPGIVEVIPIGLQRLNRIRTPFATPDVKTVSESAMIEVEGSVIYVSTELRDPISLFVTEKGQPDVALSLQLMPSRIPQVDTALDIDGVSPIAIPAQPGAARDWELDQPYVETLSELMATLARQEVPTGYGMKAFAPTDGVFLPACAFPPGVVVRPAQILTGSSLVAVIAEVRNDTPWRVDIDESACSAPGVLAVAAYPLLSLEQGQSTELYIARELPQVAPSVQRRPTVAGGFR